MTKLIFIMAILLSGSVFANNLEFNLSFKDMQSYVQSLQRIREGLGHSMPNIVVERTSVYQINAGATNDGVVITLEGLDHYGSETISSVRFVLSPQNLYLTGFIYNRVYYHFRDEVDITVGPDFADSTEAINLASNYTDLQRWSGLSRQGLELSRNNLNSGLITLMSINPQSVTRAEAGTLLRFAHVISEALRFRQIQRNVRTIFDLRPEPNVYSLSDSDIELTNAWEQLSQNFIHTTPGEQNAIRVGTIYLQNNNAILAALAMLAYCKSSKGNMSYSEGYCEAHSSKSYVVNGVVWDSKTLFFI